MPAKNTLLVLIAVLLALVLGACGVRVEIATPVAPTLTPRPYPNFDPNNGSVYRLQASPRVVFGDEAQAQIFMYPQPEVILIAYRQLWLDVPYDVTWFGAPRSTVQLGMTVYTRLDPAAAWERWDSVQQLLSTASVPASVDDSLGIALYYEDVQTLDVRTEVSITAYLENGDNRNITDVDEFTLRVLSEPAAPTPDDDRLIPAFGTLDGLLLDWRGWYGDACALGLDPACAPDAESPLPPAGTGAQLWLATAQMDETDRYTRAQRASDAGLISAVEGDWTSAAAAFALAADDFILADSPFEASVSLHNLAAALLTLGDERAWLTLTRLEELRGQFNDEAGTMLTQSNIAYTVSDYDALESAFYFFDSYDLPQTDHLEGWLDELS